jgi:hypothetical protein
MTRESLRMRDSIGFYVILYQYGVGKYVGMVESVDRKERTMVYEILSGPNKGTKKTGEFVDGFPFCFYDEDSVIKALMDK